MLDNVVFESFVFIADHVYETVYLCFVVYYTLVTMTTSHYDFHVLVTLTAMY